MPILRVINKDFFKIWTSDMAYVLGFFAADGYVTKNKRGGCFWSIQITDIDLLSKIKEVIGSNHKIGVRFPKNSDKKLYRLQIGSWEMCRDLESLGFTTNKTYSMAIPYVPARFLRDFVRGYFDGDGNVWVGFVHKDRLKKTLSIRVTFTSCSKSFLLELRRRLRLHMIMNGVFSKGKGDYYRLVYSVKGSLKLYDFMYNHLRSKKGDIFLDRKKTIFEMYKNAPVV